MRSFFKALVGLSAVGGSFASQWSGWGGNIFNNRVASPDVEVSSKSLSSLSQHCKIDHPVGVSATPVIEGTIAYYPTWGGLFLAVNYQTCQVVWQVNVTKIITDFGPIVGTEIITKPISRTSPAIDVNGGVLYFATQTHALLVALDVNSGKMLGLQQVSSHPQAIITQSPTFFDNQIFVGVSSQEESAAVSIPNYKCCSFIGSMTSWTFNRLGRTFRHVWSHDMLPYNTEWSGVAVWGSQPAIDPGRRQVFIGTGNTYTTPTQFEKCVNETAATCLPQDVLQESVIAFDIDTGRMNWINRVGALDAWTVACIKPGEPQNCPEFPGPDSDFGMAPSFVPSPNGDSRQDLLVVGQKNGILHQFNAATGEMVWATQVAPGGVGGGLSWGVAADSSRAYFTAINSANVSWNLMPSGQAIHSSGYGAADIKTGKILWETQTPVNNAAYGPPSVVNDIIIVTRSGENTPTGNTTMGGMVVLNKATGAILGDIEVAAIARGGVAAFGRYLLFGTGYNGFTGTGSLYVYRAN